MPRGIPADLISEEITRKQYPLPERACGSCNLCCTLMKVEEEDGSLVTDWMKPCTHMCKGGCGIYNDRPNNCRIFECVWLASQRFPTVAMSKSDHPDRTGVVMDVNTKNVTVVHCKTPNAYKGERAWKTISNLVNKGNKVTIEHGNGDVSVVERDLSITPMRYIGTDPESNENMYVRIGHERYLEDYK